MKIEIVFAEFNKKDPDASNVRRYFPDAKISLFNESNVKNIFEGHPRWGFRMNDYYKAKKILESDCDVAIALDADMRIVSEDAKTLPILALKFGLCLPANPRNLVFIDASIGADGDSTPDESKGTAHAVNCSPIALSLSDDRAKNCVRHFLQIMEDNPVRGPVAWWRAFYMTGFFPCLLPRQWCVCREDAGIGKEIILHEGHDEIRRFYQFAH